MGLFTLGIIGYLGENLTPYFINAISAGTGADTVTASTATSVMLIATAAVGLLCGPLAASRHRRRLARVGLVTSVFGFATAALSPALPVMFIAMAIAGIGAGGILATSGAAIAAFLNPDRVAGISGLVNSAVTAAVLAVVPLFGLVPVSVFGSIAAICALALLVVRWLPESPVRVESVAADLHALELELEDRAPGRRAALAGVALLLLFPVWGLAEGSLWAMASQFTTDKLRMPESVAGIAFSVGEIAALIGAAALAVIGGRLGRARPLAILMLISAGLKFAIGFTRDPLMFSVAFVAWDMVSAVAFLYFIAVAAGLDVSGRWSALMTASYMVGQAFSPVVGAAAVEAFGYDGFTIAIAVAGLVLVIPSVWIARISTQREQAQDAMVRVTQEQ
ncbi:MFS transporter [Microbacterium sp. NPDC089698]|uniref:MFS transporter n=1 Tax=Microbacterium sp. NPDC089698 TaxID=3364200 RepID=UPI003812CFE5